MELESASLDDNEIRYKTCIAALVQRGHNMFQDSNPFLANIHNER